MHATSKLRLTGIAIAGLALATTLAACGGSDDADNTPQTPTPPAASNTPPASASASSSGFIAYLKTLVVTMPDTTEPLDVASFVAPTDDTGAFDPTI